MSLPIYAINTNKFIYFSIITIGILIKITKRLEYKSRGEQRIAEYLDERGFDFTYERPVALLDKGLTKIWHPDFYLNDFHIIVEYFGMAGNGDYDRITDRKRLIYKSNKIDVIEIVPADFRNSWKKKIDDGVYQTLERRMSGCLSDTGGYDRNQAGMGYADAHQLAFEFSR